MNKKLISLFALIILFSLPLFVFGDIDVRQTLPPATNRPYQPADLINNILNSFVWPIVVGAVIILFIMAGMKFLTAHGEPGKLSEARSAFVWGVAGVIVILLGFSIITIVKWLTGLV